MGVMRSAWAAGWQLTGARSHRKLNGEQTQGSGRRATWRRGHHCLLEGKTGSPQAD